jgi:hypothetical protein
MTLLTSADVDAAAEAFAVVDEKAESGVVVAAAAAAVEA